MSSSRLSHIRQLWAELRDQIRSLQSSIWENTTLASNAWQRSSFEAITEMLSHLTHDEGNTNSNSTGSSSSPSGNQSTSNPQPNIPSTYLPSDTFSSELFRLSSANSVFSARSSLSPSEPSTSSTLRSPSRSHLRGYVHRRPNNARRMLHMRHQNSARRHGTTAGILRAQRTTSGRLSQPTSTVNEESESQSAPSDNPDSFLEHHRNLIREVPESSQHQPTSSTSELNLSSSEAATGSER